MYTLLIFKKNTWEHFSISPINDNNITRCTNRLISNDVNELNINFDIVNDNFYLEHYLLKLVSFQYE